MFAKTLKGRYFDFVGHFFSIYCIYKIFIVSPVMLSVSLRLQCVYSIFLSVLST